MSATDGAERRTAVFGETAGVRAPAARLGVAVVTDLVEAIVSGQLSPGDKLPPVNELTLRFGVSRTVLRESIKRVEEKGLISAEQGRGTTINPPSSWCVLDPDVLAAMVDDEGALGVLDDLSIVRGSLESSMAYSAASCRTAERDGELTAAFDASIRMMSSGAARDDSGPAFHATIMQQSDNRLAANITRMIFARADVSTRFTGAPECDPTPVALEEHGVVLEAILAGDSDRAAFAMRDHIANAYRRGRPPLPRPATAAP